MSDKIVSIFDRFSSSKTNEQPKTALESYQAATLERSNKQAFGIKINYSDGRILQIDYNYHKYAVSDVPDCLILVFTIGAVVIDGQNLRLLFDDLLDQRIRALQPFDANRHKPVKEGEPLIHAIRWQSMKAIEELMPAQDSQ